MNDIEETNNTNEKNETIDEQGFWISKSEKEKIEKKLISISDFQRFSSLMIWFALAMVILHIGADIFFHVLN